MQRKHLKCFHCSCFHRTYLQTMAEKQKERTGQVSIPNSIQCQVFHELSDLNSSLQFVEVYHHHLEAESNLSKATELEGKLGF